MVDIYIPPDQKCHICMKLRYFLVISKSIVRSTERILLDSAQEGGVVQHSEAAKIGSHQQQSLKAVNAYQ